MTGVKYPSGLTAAVVWSSLSVKLSVMRVSRVVLYAPPNECKWPDLSNLPQVCKSEDEEQNLTDSETPKDEDEKAAGSVIRSDKSHQLKLFYWACSELKLQFIMAPVSACSRNCARKQSNCRPQDTDVNGAFKPALTVVHASVCDVNLSFYCHWRLFCVGRKSQRLQKRSGEKNNANTLRKVSEFTLCTLLNFTHKDRKTSHTGTAQNHKMVHYFSSCRTKHFSEYLFM